MLEIGRLTHSTSFLFTFEEFAREMIFLVDTMEEVRIWPFCRINYQCFQRLLRLSK